MDDQSFNEVRDALAPSRERAGRIGALFILEASLDQDDRLHSLFATLLRDRDAEVAAGAAAIVYRTPHLRDQLERELSRAWQSAAPEYRVHLLHAADEHTLQTLAERIQELPDAALKLAALARSEAFPSLDARLEFALYLSRDASEAVRAEALKSLAAMHEPGSLRAAERLLHDPAPAVRIAAINAYAELHADEERVEELTTLRDALRALQEDQDFEVRGAVADHLREIQTRLNNAQAQALVTQQRELIDAGEFHRALGLASQVMMRIPEHPEATFQMARAAAGLKDIRRATRLMANALELGLADAGRCLDDPIFDPLTETEVWGELLAMIQEQMHALPSKEG